MNQSLLLKEIEILVNRVSLSLHELGAIAYTYDKEKDAEQLVKDCWDGRGWRFKDSVMELTKVPGQAQLCFIIHPIKNA